VTIEQVFEMIRGADLSNLTDLWDNLTEAPSNTDKTRWRLEDD